MRALKLLLCILMVLTLVSCGDTEPVPEKAALAYLEAFSKMDFEAMWALCRPAVPISEEDFLEKYKAIFSGLGVTTVDITDVTEPDENGVFRYTAVYHTEEYGDFSDQYVLSTISFRGQSYVYWNYSLIFPEMQEGSNVRVRTIRAKRGEIFGADGSLLAANDFADTLYMDTTKVLDIAEVARAAAPLTGLSDTEIIKRFNDAQDKGTQIVALGTFFKGQVTEEQKQSVLLAKGLGFDDKMYTPIRDYPLGISASHIIGYTGYVGEDALPEGYTTSDRLGVEGLEKSYETQLRGKDGKLVCIEDKWGKNVRTLFEQPVEQGQDLRLTIKPWMQKKAYELLETNLSAELGQSGVAIVMDASTGFVEAIASYPSFDNNMFTFGVSKEQWDHLMAAESNRPLFSRATQGLYPPGSVIKPFTAATALEDGAITSESTFDGEITSENKWLSEENNISVTRIDDKAGTPLQLANAMRASDNIFFAWAALRLGADKLTEYFERIGFSQEVLFDLPVATSSDKKNTTMMTNQLLADMGYGQAELVITPLQMASMYTAFANKQGDIMQPALVQKVCRTEGLDYVTLSETQGKVWIENAISHRSLDTLSPILKDVVQNGTAKPIRIRGVGIAGKTGTAEKGDDKSREISWIAGYWTDGYYDRLVVVMVDVAAAEGPVKFEIAKALLSP